MRGCLLRITLGSGVVTVIDTAKRTRQREEVAIIRAGLAHLRRDMHMCLRELLKCLSSAWERWLLKKLLFHMRHTARMLKYF